jgi:hypothetical protein
MRGLRLAQKLQPVTRFELGHPVHEVTLVVPGRDRLVPVPPGLRTAKLTDEEAVRILTAMVLAAATKGSRDKSDGLASAFS